jgi:hypothetical protein
MGITIADLNTYGVTEDNPSMLLRHLGSDHSFGVKFDLILILPFIFCTLMYFAEDTRPPIQLMCLPMLLTFSFAPKAAPDSTQ